MNLSINNNATNYQQNFTSRYKLPSNKQIRQILPKDLAQDVINMKKDIKKNAKRGTADVEVVVSPGFVDYYVGKMGKKPWQTYDNTIGQWVKPSEPRWIRDSYNVDFPERIRASLVNDIDLAANNFDVRCEREAMSKASH